MTPIHKITPFALVMLGLSLSSCKKEEDATQAPPPVSEVKFRTVRTEPLVVKSSQPGRLEAFRQAEVRARVPGIVLSRPYVEGQEVKAGTILFQIDPAPLKAAFDSAAAALEEAETGLLLAKDKKERFGALAPGNAISAREMKEADSEEKQAASRIASAVAAKETAKLRLEYATVVSPIDGRARKAAVTEGALVGEDSPTLLTTVEQIDPIYVNFSRPVSEVMALRKAMNLGNVEGLQLEDIKVEIVLGDGTIYPQPGKLIFSDLAVDAGTDAVQLRALVPNAGRELFPGMFVRVNLDVATQKEAILVPRDALLRTADGPVVMTINARNEVTPVPVEAKEIHGNRWHVTSGLSGGERIIVENAMMAPVGSQVTPTEVQ